MTKQEALDRADACERAAAAATGRVVRLKGRMDHAAFVLRSALVDAPGCRACRVSEALAILDGGEP